MPSHSSWPTAIVHVDADCFFASCEVALDSSLRGKPICVIGGGSQTCPEQRRRKGVVTSPSYEARALGVKTAMPTYQAMKLAPQCLFIEGHFEHYGMLSRKIFSVLDNYSPVVEEASIDEGYVDLTGLRRMHKCSYVDIAKQIQQDVLKTVEVPISVGLTPTKILSKIASDFHKPNGFVVVSAKNVTDFIRQVAIKEIPGIGTNSQALLAKYNVSTAWDLTQLGEAKLKRMFGKRGSEMCHELLGVSMYPVTSAVQPHKSISRSRTLDTPTANEDILRSQIVTNLSLLTTRLRRYRMATRIIGIFLRDQSFGTTAEKVRLPRPMRIDDELLPYAIALFHQCYRPHTTYRLTGIVLGDLSLHDSLQPSLFDDVRKLQKQHNMADATDVINARFGRGTISRASTKIAPDDLIVCSFKKGSDINNAEL